MIGHLDSLIVRRRIGKKEEDLVCNDPVHLDYPVVLGDGLVDQEAVRIVRYRTPVFHARDSVTRDGDRI